MEGIEACGRMGVTVTTVLADGFGEAGEAGRAREARLREIVAATGMRIVGPSSLGIVNMHNGALITANAAFDAKDVIDLQIVKQGKQAIIRKPAIGGKPNSRELDVLKDKLESAFDDGQFVAFHPALEDRLPVGAPEDRHRPASDNQGNNQ